MSDMFWIFVSAAVVTNFVLVYFLGLCPVIGVTNKSVTGLRLGLATTFVMVLASLAAWALNAFVLDAAPFLRVISFVVAIASIVQIVELFVKKVSPPLYRELGIFLPLIASNSQVLGMTIFQTNRGYTLLQGLVFAVGGGLGITAVLSLVGGIRERMAFAPVPAIARGPALVFLIVAMLSLVFMGFAGMGTA
ncbi:RnfA-Nqr electron transport subunit (plasmid) [Gemmatirosa kalamazoonensis]|uniref:RnfA-Nqr electron transport subunit n=1 Tax=Gemmatirosa kalamazoonensis TaxID=861299 RepID=W0RPF2_9BACT|nr:Rnf-Nqr domain containing protein [Gemmatirosa kalamazoonensis]AHG92611.1 RnfA-Nqr electron transport subunit [Gemmatirosa kalamazoonensis]